MSDPSRAKALSRLLGAAGRAHHELIGGANPEWAQWYAEYLVEHDIAAHVGGEPGVDTVADWLERADASHRREAPEQPWPPHYAEWILDHLDEENGSGENGA